MKEISYDTIKRMQEAIDGISRYIPEYAQRELQVRLNDIICEIDLPETKQTPTTPSDPFDNKNMD